MTTTELLMATFGLVNAVIFSASASIAFLVYRWNDRQKKKDRALDFHKALLTGEFLLRARLTCHEYLLEDPRNETYRKFKGLDFDELDAALRLRGTEQERADRFLLRAIPNFFGAVDMARRHGYLNDGEGVFSEIYAWYWVNIIEERQVPGNPMFTLHKWMTTEADLQKARQDRALRLGALNKSGR